MASTNTTATVTYETPRVVDHGSISDHTFRIPDRPEKPRGPKLSF